MGSVDVVFPACKYTAGGPRHAREYSDPINDRFPETRRNSCFPTRCTTLENESTLAEPKCENAPGIVIICAFSKRKTFAIAAWNTNQLTLGHDFLTLSHRNNITCLARVCANGRLFSRLYAYFKSLCKSSILIINSQREREREGDNQAESALKIHLLSRDLFELTRFQKLKTFKSGILTVVFKCETSLHIFIRISLYLDSEQRKMSPVFYFPTYVLRYSHNYSTTPRSSWIFIIIISLIISF